MKIEKGWKLIFYLNLYAIYIYIYGRPRVKLNYKTIYNNNTSVLFVFWTFLFVVLLFVTRLFLFTMKLYKQFN